MKKTLAILLVNLAVLVCCFAQQKITIISNKENNYCNGTCTLLNIPELNNNPDAIIFVTPLATVSHPIATYYIQTKRDMAQWSILNLDNTQMQVGTQFSVEYYVQPDTIHFLHVIALKNLRNNGSYIDHAGLNDNPNAQFKFFQNLAPIARGGIANNYDLKIQYDTVVHRWYMFNTNNRQLSYGDGYNISISSGGNANTIAVLGKSGIIVDTANPKIINKATDTIPVIGNAGAVNKVDPKLVPGKTVSTTYDFSNVKICIDKINNNPLPPRPLVPSTAVLPKIKPNGDLETISKVTQGLTSVTDQMWSPGETIKVGLYGGNTSLFVLNKVKQYAKEWEVYANIKFLFVDPFSLVNGASTQIKVGFVQDNTSWSWIGRDVMNNSKSEMTMNFGWFDDNTDEAEFRRVIVHEFGHALGFVHEHQSPVAGIPWNTAKVYAFFEGDPNDWSKEKIDQNIFELYSKTGTNYSAYDPLSIMHYWFPPELTTNGTVFTHNTDLSETDKQYAGVFYPFQRYPGNATGTLQIMSGGNCDVIGFLVEYNVVDKSEVEFVLDSEKDPNSNTPVITSWKKIGIPGFVGSEMVLEMQNGFRKVGRIPVALIDKNRGISFGKANLLGMPIDLNYKWNVWPAIIGGCRITLIWQKDKCN